MQLVRTRLSEFADLLGYRVVRDCTFTYPAKILSPIDDILTPLVRADALADLLGRDGVSGVIATEALADQAPASLGLAIADDPMSTHDALHRILAGMPGRLWVDFETEISPLARVHDGALVAGRNVRVLAGAEVLPGAIVHERSVIGPDSRVHSQAVVGAEAYEIVIVDGHQKLRPQTGGVVLERGCEILSGTVVTRAAFGGATRLMDHVVLDGNVTISHDAHIGEETRIGGGSWIGGRVVIGRHVSVGPGCIVANGLRIGDGAKLSLGAVVTQSVETNEQVTGNFAVPHAKFLQHMRNIR